MLGLSDRGVEKFLPLLDCRGSKSSIDRDVGAAGQRAQDLHRQAPRMRVRVVGVDGRLQAAEDRGLETSGPGRRWRGRTGGCCSWWGSGREEG